MIGRERLRQANKHAKRRGYAFSRPWSDSLLSELPLWQRYRKVTKPCSCMMCGNPRRHWGQRTWQERRAMLAQESE